MENNELMLIRVDHKRAREIYDNALRRFNLMMPELLEAVADSDAEIIEENRKQSEAQQREWDEYNALPQSKRWPSIPPIPRLGGRRPKAGKFSASRNRIKRMAAISAHAVADFNVDRETVIEMDDLESGVFFTRLRIDAGLPVFDGDGVDA